MIPFNHILNVQQDSMKSIRLTRVENYVYAARGTASPTAWVMMIRA